MSRPLPLVPCPARRADLFSRGRRLPGRGRSRGCGRNRGGWHQRRDLVFEAIDTLGEPIELGRVRLRRVETGLHRLERRLDRSEIAARLIETGLRRAETGPLPLETLAQTIDALLHRREIGFHRREIGLRPDACGSCDSGEPGIRGVQLRRQAAHVRGSIECIGAGDPADTDDDRNCRRPEPDIFEGGPGLFLPRRPGPERDGIHGSEPLGGAGAPRPGAAAASPARADLPAAFAVGVRRLRLQRHDHGNRQSGGFARGSGLRLVAARRSLVFDCRRRRRRLSLGIGLRVVRCNRRRRRLIE